MEVLLYVLGMTKNMTFVATLEDKGYIVTFEDGKVYSQPKDSRTTKMIRVKKVTLFGLQFELAQALVCCNGELGELWH